MKEPVVGYQWKWYRTRVGVQRGGRKCLTVIGTELVERYLSLAEMRMSVVWGNQLLDWRKNDNWHVSRCVCVCGDVSKPTCLMRTSGSQIQQKCELEWVGIDVNQCPERIMNLYSYLDTNREGACQMWLKELWKDGGCSLEAGAHNL